MPINRRCQRKILEKLFNTKKCTQCKRSHTLKTDVIELPDNKNIEKLFSKHELFFLGQSNFSSNPFQVLLLQYPIPRAPLSNLPSLSKFTLVNWNPSSAQSSSCSWVVSLFCPTQFKHTLQFIGCTKLYVKPSQSNLLSSYI